MYEEALSRDTLFHDRKENMSPWQREQYEIMQGINHFINCALHERRELSSGQCITMPYSVFLTSLTDEFEKTIRTRQECIFDSQASEQRKIAVFDDFLRIADFANVAIKNVIRNPSRQIQKVDVKLPAAQASSFTSKTMQWMSRRPGRTIAEKISPENKILTTKTVFSVDTKENRELMYLYKHLYQIVSTRLASTKCMLCNKHNDCQRGWLVNMQRMLSAYSRIKTDELGAVKAEKQAMQNNKLMCDLNYKIIWDAVQMLTHVEEDITKQFSNVPNRLARLIYWLLIGSVLKDRRAKIYDSIGAVVDKEGEIKFVRPTDNQQALSDQVIIVNENEVYQYSLTFKCNDSTVKVVRSKNSEEGTDCILEVDVAAYFHELENYYTERKPDKPLDKDLSVAEPVSQVETVDEVNADSDNHGVALKEETE